MEGNCYSWLCRLMSTVSFSQHHALKIRVGQGVLGTVPSPPCHTWARNSGGFEHPFPGRECFCAGYGDGLVQAESKI